MHSLDYIISGYLFEVWQDIKNRLCYSNPTVNPDSLLQKAMLDISIDNVYNTNMARKRDKQFLIWLDENIHGRLKKLAEKEGRSISELVRESIADLLKKREVEQILKKRR